MKKNSKLWLILFCFAAVLIHIIYIWQDNKIEEGYECSTGVEIPEINGSYPVGSIIQSFTTEYSSLNSLEFMFGDIPDKTAVMTVKILKSGKTIYQSSISLENLESDVWHRLYVNIPIKKQQEYEIELTAGSSTQAPYIYTVTGNNGAPENQSLVMDGVRLEEQLLVRYGYLKEPLTMDKALGTITSLLVLGLMIFLIMNGGVIYQHIKRYVFVLLEKMGGGHKQVFIISQLILCYLLIEDAGIVFQIPVKIVLYCISLLAGYKSETVVKYFKTRLTDWPSRIQFGIVVLFGGFSFVGNRMFIYPLNMKVTPQQILMFAAAVIWITPAAALFLSWYNSIKPVREKQMSSLKFTIIAALLLLIPACFALYAFNPGISSPDTRFCLATAAHSIRNMTDWHPPFYCLILKVIISIWDSTYAVIMVQFFFWAYVMIEGMLFLRKRGVSQKFLLSVAFLLGINPAVYLHLCTIWKDVPYAIALLWLTIIIARVTLERDVKHKWYIYLEFMTALIFTFFIRQNGMVVYVLTAFFTVIVFRRNVKLLGTVFLSLVLILFIKYPLYSYIGVQDSGGGIYIGLSQDILGVYYAGGSLSEDTMEMVNVLTDYNNGQYSYNPYWSSSTYNLDVPITAFIKNYINTFLKNPVIMLKEIICRQDCIWDLFGGQNAVLGCVNYTGTQDSIESWNHYYPERVSNQYTYSMQKLQAYGVENQLLNVITWKSGIYTLFTVFTFFSVLIKKADKKLWLVFVPFIGQILSLMLSTGWSDFRYYLALNFIAVFVILLVTTIKYKEKGEPDEISNIEYSLGGL